MIRWYLCTEMSHRQLECLRSEESLHIFIQISLKYIPKVSPIDNK